MIIWHSAIICGTTFSRIRYDMRMAMDEAQLANTRTPEPGTSYAKPAKFHWALTALGIATILSICYWAELVLAVVMFSVMLAFILAPVVDFLMRWHLPRGVAALVSVTLLVTIVAVLVYYTSNQAATFFQDVPQYAGKIRVAITDFRQRIESFGGLKSQEQSRSSTDWTGPLMRGVGPVTQGLVAASFVPFLVYFMLTWQHHVRSATVMLFSLENRHTAYVTLGLIAAMIRSFMVGNLLIGLFMGTVSTIVLGILQFPFLTPGGNRGITPCVRVKEPSRSRGVIPTAGGLSVHKGTVCCRHIRRHIQRYWILRRLCRSRSCSACCEESREIERGHRRRHS